MTALNDPRVKAAVIADPLAVVFGPASFAAVKVPVQLWASERGGDGVSPESVAAVDTIYRRRTNITWCRMRRILLFSYRVHRSWQAAT